MLQWFNLEAKLLRGSSLLLFLSGYGGVESGVVAEHRGLKVVDALTLTLIVHQSLSAALRLR